MTEPPTQPVKVELVPPPPPAPGLSPSNSTSASVVGGSLATLIIYILAQKGITFPAGAEASLAVLATSLAGYLPKSGRQ